MDSELQFKDDKLVLYGIYDTKDNCWLGDEHGPKRFDDFMLARVASQIYEDQVFGTDLLCRYQAKQIPDDKFTHKDEVLVKRTTLQSLERIERREGPPGEDIVLSPGDWIKDA